MSFVAFFLSILVFTGLAVLVVRPVFKKAILSLGAGLLLLVTVVHSVVIVENEDIGVTRVFGETNPGFLAPGFHFLKPWASVTKYQATRKEFPVDESVITKDNNPLAVSVGFAIRLNPELAWKIQKNIGSDYFDTLVVPAGRTAVRDGIAGFNWADAATSGRGEVQQAIQSNFERILVEQFSANGLAVEEAERAVQVSPVQLRQSKPDQKVLNATAERSAAEQDLKRQEVLTRIAKEEAERRKNEGAGVSNLFAELPQGFTSSEIAEVLLALAAKTRADAMLKAVESNQVKTIIMNGDTAGGVAASFQNGPLTVRQIPVPGN